MTIRTTEVEKTMNQTHDIESKPKQKVDRPDETTRPGLYFQPAVDIFETPEEGIGFPLSLNGIGEGYDKLP